MGEERPQHEFIMDCPYCGHAWKTGGRWVHGPCPKCGEMTYRYMYPEHD